MKWVAKLIVRTISVFWAVFKTIWFTGLVAAFVVSLTMNVAVYSTGVIATAISAGVEAVFGLKSVVNQLEGEKAKVAKLETKAEVEAAKAAKLETKAAAEAAKAAKLETKAAAEAAKAEKLGAKAASAELAASKWEGKAVGTNLSLAEAEAKASKWEGKAVGTELRLADMIGKKAALEVEAVGLRAAKRVEIEGVEMTVQDAVSTVARRVKTRTVKVASADLGATIGQSLPWIGVAVVVTATAYDLNVSCDNMKDMRALDVAFNPDAANDPSLDYVCGMKVPTKEEIWATIMASPGAAWDMAKSALDQLP